MSRARPLAAARIATSPSGRKEKSPASVDDEQERRAINRVTLVALWAWPSFHVLDCFMVLALYPEAAYSRFVALRLAGEAVLAVTWWLGRRRTTNPTLLRWAHRSSYVFLGLEISIMAIQVGGLHSTYLHGISIVVLGRSMLVPARWPRSLIESTLTVGSFPLVMALAGLLPPSGSGDDNGRALAVFVSNLIFPVGSAIVGAFCSEVAWAAQRQIYRARRIGRYRLQAPIGKGGMGEMGLAWDEALRRYVALKLLRGEEADQTSLARFEREARAASQLTDPHTIRIFDFGGTDDGIHFIAMEYLPGADLASVVRRHGPLSPGRVVHLVRQACAALAEAHAAGIVHRDIKPENLFVTRIGTELDFLKVLDFGIARVLNAETDAGLTEAGRVPGTPAYLAPEVARGKAADMRSDVYALGATMDFLLTGGTRLDRAPVGAYSDAVSGGLDAIVERCLDADPERRFQSVRDLDAALAACHVTPAWTAADAATFWQVTDPEVISRSSSTMGISRD
jgi:tRNA A-37 threonylcarbamoyl transferase component Bud32